MRDVLVLQLARFGDIVQTKRLLLSLAADRQTRVHLCVDNSLASLAGLLYPFAHIHSLPAHLTPPPAGQALSPGMAAQGKDSSAPASFLPRLFPAVRKTFADLTDIGFSEVYLLNFSPLTFACASLFPSEILRGYARDKGQDLRGQWTSITFSFMRDRRFSPLNLMDLWAFLHPSPCPPEKVNPIPRAAGSKRVGIVMAGRASRRSLPPPVLAACVQAVFQGRGGPELICIGTREERPLVRQLLREIPSRTAGKVENRAGQTSLNDLPGLLRELDLLLTPDTGTMHLAVHLGVPVQAFFLSSAWCWETSPYAFGHKIWQAIEPCSPCRESASCGYKQVCLAPFRHPAFLALLAGKFTPDWPRDLLGCISTMDDLGVTYEAVDGEDPHAGARSDLRCDLAFHLGIPGPSRSPARREPAGNLFTEKNWMLPECLGSVVTR